MILVLVGRVYSDKYKVARDLNYHSKGRFTRLKSYTTGTNAGCRTHYHMPESERVKHDDSEILYSVTNERGIESFFMKSQFWESRDVIIVFDDPVGLEKLHELNIPYAVVFVDCSEGTILSRAEEFSRDLKSVEYRLDIVRERMLEFDERGEYSLYLDTSKLSPTSRTLAVSVFITQVRKWLKTRQPNEMCMPYLKDMASGSMLRAARAMGYGVAFI